ncbi:MAG: nicotinate-nucleotide--dimethylbenzimidazole phosphoribosyltransferase [Cohaesibacteraceae bacterium]|nr:nicotinate-nucleotide--dimethylbenzimidazole phosphoribosyltransferase [Cohaesibacteraceae bacterium]
MTAADTGLPFDDIRNLIRLMPEPDQAAFDAACERDALLTKPAGSLGKLEKLAFWVAMWQGRKPQITRPLVAIFAGNHGVANQGVSAFPSSVTAQMVENFAAGGAAINQLCVAYDLGLKVFDLALEVPTGDITLEDAMDESSCAATMAFGMEAVAGGTDLLCIGEMGIANTTVASAIYLALYGGEAEDWIGRGTGVDDDGLKRKADAVRKAVSRLNGEKDPLEILRIVGGRELAAMAGAIIAARSQRIPVILDGFVATAAAAIIQSIRPDALDHCLMAHVSAESAHKTVLEKMGKEPLLDLGMRLGEGSGAALAASIVKGAVATHSDMATFADAGVAGSTD